VSLVSWTSQSRPIHCRVCEFDGSGELVATVTALAEIDLPAVRCPECGSVQLRDEALDSSPSDASVDGYVEGGVGLGAIADSMSLADLTRVRRFLDVGCNYGFALDLGRFLFDWDVVGVEPSLAGRRGAVELGLDIRDEYLVENSQLGEPFDLILASEVVEHVTDPVGFLRAIAAHLAPGGQAVLTTPAAEIVQQGMPESEVVAAISPGYHVFIASQRGLELLLRRAGFTTVKVDRVRGSLRAVASVDDTPIVSTPIDGEQLDSYLAHAASSAPRGSALQLGMAVRSLRSLVARGDFSTYRDAVSAVRKAFVRRYHMRVTDPAALTSKLRSDSETPPWSLAGAAFALGMIELSHRERPVRASQYFELSNTAARLWRSAAQVADLDTVDLLFQSAYHRALALSRVDAEAATSAVLSLGEWLDPTVEDRAAVLARRECRVFVEIAARGAVAPGGELERRVDARSRTLAASPDRDDRMAGLDAMLVLGLAALQRGRTEEARDRLSECERMASSVGADDHARSVARSCRDHLDALPDVVSDDESIQLHSAIDTYWCDAFGTFLDGWIHAGELEVDAVTVTIGGVDVVAARSDRADLLEYWPHAPAVVRGGFSAYLPGAVGREALITVTTANGRASTRVALPAHPLPVGPASTDHVTLVQRAVDTAPSGPVLVVGLRAPTDELAQQRIAEFGSRAVTSLDIHEGHGVTHVGDAHRMSAFLPRDSFSLVYSSDVLEHLTTPWVFAAECARVLKVGGLAVHLAPWVWPTHATPNDFYRYSPEGLEQLFGASLGFRIMARGGAADARVYPDPTWRDDYVRMPTTTSVSHSWVIAEKVSSVADAISWPYDERDGEAAAREYPVDGLAP